MPLYEYQCRNCETRFERIEHVSAPSDGVCPSCGAAARRLLGAPALQFKGSGWYVTDYAKGNGNGAHATAVGESSSESKSETKSESKSETASASESSSKSESPSKGDSQSKSESSTKSDSKVA